VPPQLAGLAIRQDRVPFLRKKYLRTNFPSRPARGASQARQSTLHAEANLTRDATGTKEQILESRVNAEPCLQKGSKGT
jgi:hypothetical protein